MVISSYLLLITRYGMLSIEGNIIDIWYKRGYEGVKLPTPRKLAEYFNTTLDYWILDEISGPNYGKSSRSRPHALPGLLSADGICWQR